MTKPLQEPQVTKKSRLRRLAIDVTPLRYGPFRRLWMGQGVSYIGIQVTAVAVPVQVYDLTHSSLWVGILGLANLLPLIVFGLWGGAVADHMDRRRLVLIASCVSWGATILLLLQALLNLRNVAVIMAITTRVRLVTARNSPFVMGVMPGHDGACRHGLRRTAGLPKRPLSATEQVASSLTGGGNC